MFEAGPDRSAFACWRHPSSQLNPTPDAEQKQRQRSDLIRVRRV